MGSQVSKGCVNFKVLHPREGLWSSYNCKADRD